MKDLVSIIVPAYNHEKFISQCIESIIKQTYENIELIILNDGSKDNTAKIIRTYEQKCKERFNTFIFIDKKNEGICKTLNKGIEASKGQYICFLASDDLMVNTCISDCVNYFIENEDIERVISNFYIDYFDINKKEVCYKSNPRWESYMNSQRDKFFIENVLKNELTVFGMYSKSAFDKVGLFDENLLIEDWDMNLRVLYNNINLGYISKPLYYYRKHSNNTSGYENYKFMLKGCLQIIEKIEKNYNLSFKNKSIIKKSKSCKYIEFATILKNNGNDNYKIYVDKAINEFPFNSKIYKFFIKRFIGKIINLEVFKIIKKHILKL